MRPVYRYFESTVDLLFMSVKISVVLQIPERASEDCYKIVFVGLTLDGHDSCAT